MCRLEGELEGATALIPAMYVAHAENWRELLHPRPPTPPNDDDEDRLIHAPSTEYTAVNGHHGHLYRRGTPPEDAYAHWLEEHDEAAPLPPSHSAPTRDADVRAWRLQHVRGARVRESPGAPEAPPHLAKILHIANTTPGHINEELTRHKEKRALIAEARKKAFEIVPSLQQEPPRSFIRHSEPARFKITTV